MTKPNKVAVLDAGGQYVDLVKKAVERRGIPADVLPLGTQRAELEKNYGAIIISGSPASSVAQEAPQPDPDLWQSPLPILGICYGMQAMVTAHGGSVIKNAIREDGRVLTHIDNSSPLFSGIKADLMGLFTHGDFVKQLPVDFKTIGSHTMPNGEKAFSAIASGNNYGVQFHPEVFDDTPEGYQIFKNFLISISGLTTDTNFEKRLISRRIATKLEAIKKQVNGSHVIAFVSGGVDSSVAATLASRVIPKERFHAFYIDSGFMRKEDDEVVASLQNAGLSVQKIDAVEEFEQGTVAVNGKTIGPLLGVTDPEEKRKIIGKVFIDIQNQAIQNLKLDRALLLQGTNAADRIESGHSSGDSYTQTIKTHHNQVKEVQALKAEGLLLEPLDDLFKDEIRQLGRELGLDEDLVMRQPFPGPGLAIRIIATDKENELHEPTDTQAKIQSYMSEQASETTKAHVLPVRSVGVGGDERSHLSVVALQAEPTFPNNLAQLATDLPSRFKDDINRVILALSDTSLTTCYITKTTLGKIERDQLKAADEIVFEEMRKENLLDSIIQFPVILLPLSFETKGKRSIALRPVATSTFMTVQAMLPGRDLPEQFFRNVTKRILNEVDGISEVFLDCTNKPPATTEWE